MLRINNLRELDEYISSPSPCIVKIGAACCGACVITEKSMESSKKNHPNIHFGTIDCDTCQEELLEKYQVEELPVVLFSKNGAICDRVDGRPLSGSELEEKIKTNFLL